MTAKILDGKSVARQIKAELAQRVVRLGKAGVVPGLGTIVVGSDPASLLYVDGKHRDCAEVGIKSLRIELPEDSTIEDIFAAVDSFNQDSACTGFIVQLPLPSGIDTNVVLARVLPGKDVDGLHPFNLGSLVLNTRTSFTTPVPCTPRGIVELGRRYGLEWAGKRVCVVGQGRTVGRPLSLLLAHDSINATVDACHAGTVNLKSHTLAADIVVVATGVAHLLQPDMIRAGAAVFDVGITRQIDAITGKPKIVGDVNPQVQEIAGWFAPNPGGVGLMTRAMLLQNIVEVAERNCS